MKVIYCGCKSVMKTQRSIFPRGKVVEVTDEIGTEIMKIDGFFLTMTADAKKELKANENREKLEIKKLKQVNQVVVEDDDAELIESKEIKVLSDALGEAASQLKQSRDEGDSLSEQLGAAEAKIEDLEKQLLVEQSKNAPTVKAK